MPPQNPLTDADLEDIDRALEQIRDAEQIMDQAKRAGIDVAMYEQRGREAKDRLLRVKQTFFPGR